MLRFFFAFSYKAVEFVVRETLLLLPKRARASGRVYPFLEPRDRIARMEYQGGSGVPSPRDSRASPRGFGEIWTTTRLPSYPADGHTKLHFGGGVSKKPCSRWDSEFP